MLETDFRFGGELVADLIGGRPLNFVNHKHFRFKILDRHIFGLVMDSEFEAIRQQSLNQGRHLPQV